MMRRSRTPFFERSVEWLSTLASQGCSPGNGAGPRALTRFLGADKLSGVPGLAAMEYVASRVIRMGWSQAVSLFQHLHRSIGMTNQPIGAGHALEKEWRRDRPAPQTSDGNMTEFVQFYLDR